jgi:hypothetical protein
MIALAYAMRDWSRVDSRLTRCRTTRGTSPKAEKRISDPASRTKGLFCQHSKTGIKVERQYFAMTLVRSQQRYNHCPLLYALERYLGRTFVLTPTNNHDIL